MADIDLNITIPTIPTSVGTNDYSAESGDTCDLTPTIPEMPTHVASCVATLDTAESISIIPACASKVSIANQYITFGNINLVQHNLVAKFDTIDLNNAETVNDAKITFTHQAAISTTVCNANVYLNDIDTAVFPERNTDAEALDITAGVEWSGIDAGVVNAELVGPAIKADVQTVVDRVGWANGNDMLVLVKDNTSDTDAYRQIYGGAYVGTEGMNKNPKLGVYFDYRHWKVLGVTNPATVFGYTAAQINKINGLL